MKNILFIMAVMLTISACDVIEQRSLGDDLLTVFDNKTKATKSIAYRGNKLLTDCRDFRLADYTHRTTTFIAVTDNGESLYRFSNEGGKETLTKYYSAKHIEYGATELGDVFIGTLADGRQEVFHIFKRLVTGPYDRAYPMVTGVIYQQNGLYGMEAADGTPYIEPQYEKIYVIGFDWTRYCTYKGNGMYDVNALKIRMVRGQEVYFLSKCGTISQQDIDELRQYSLHEFSEYSFVADCNRDRVPHDLFDRVYRNFND